MFIGLVLLIGWCDRFFVVFVCFLFTVNGCFSFAMFGGSVGFGGCD